MRKLMWFAIGFAAACAVGAYLLFGGWYLLFALLGGALALISLCFRRPKGKIAVMICVGCLVGFLWQYGYDALYLSGARKAADLETTLTVTASDYGYPQKFGTSVDGRTLLDGKQYRIRVYLYDTYDIAPGDVINGTFMLRYTGARDDNKNTYQQSKGIFLVAYETDVPDITKAETVKLPDYPAIWRHKILSLLDVVFPGDCVGFTKALLLGQTDSLTYAQDRSFQVSGIRHVVAVSGLHVSILFSLLYLFVGRNRWLVPLIGIPVLILFAAMAGFTPSIVRACIMQALISLSMLTEKEYDPPTALSFSALVLLAVNPFVITAVGFQLSVGCMIGIFCFSRNVLEYFLSFGNLKIRSKGKSFRARLIRGIAGSVSVTLSAMFFTMPLCAAYFGMVSIAGILTNLLVLWVISFVFYGIVLCCVLGLLWLPAACWVANIVAIPIRYVLVVSKVITKIPFAAVYTDSPYIVLWFIFTYILLLVFLVMKKKYPGILAAGVIFGLCFCIGLSWLEPRLYDTQISVIDVGQGQSILLQSGDEHYLVDCGSTSPDRAADTVANLLLSRGIHKLTGVILTHYDSDHAGAVMQLSSTIPIQQIYLPDIQDNEGMKDMLITHFNTCCVMIRDTTVLPVLDGKITLYPGENTESDNENSMCVLFQKENCDILITGDRSSSGERKLLRQTDLPQLEILVVGHHGSHTATSYELLHATRPAVAVISAGKDNPYGHPRSETLERLELYGCRICRTDLLGTIHFRR